MTVAVMEFLDVFRTCFGPIETEPREDRRSRLAFCEFPVLDLEFCEKDAAALVLPLPVFGAVEIPVLAEGGREGFGKEQELDYVAARGKIFFAAGYGMLVFVYIGKACLRALFSVGLYVVVDVTV